jgi:hypothetical protein
MPIDGIASLTVKQLHGAAKRAQLATELGIQSSNDCCKK